VLVQLCGVRFGFDHVINRRAVEGFGGIAVDGIVLCAIGTLSLGALGAQVGPLVVLAVGSIAWSIVAAMVIGRRIFRENWFEHALAEFGESQGNVATGFVMVDMADPLRRTDVVSGYSYRQLITRPFLGGGFLSALAIPLIAAWGLPVFTAVAVIVTVGLAIAGIRRAAARGASGAPGVISPAA
jgi:ESS family glutamate:Na+ symporter